MAYDSKKVETAQALFAAAIDIMKTQYNIPAEKVSDAMAIANLAGKAIKWDCLKAQDLSFFVLEEVNEHTLAENFRAMADHHNRTFDMEEA